MNTRLFAAIALAAVIAASWVASCVIYRAAEWRERVSPLEIRQFDRLTLVAVGTGGGYENPERLGPCSAIGWGEHVVLVDAGRAVAEALRTAKIRVHQPALVLLTNLLPENTLGLDDLLYTGWLRGREAPLQVIGPSGTRALVESLLAAREAGAEALGATLHLAAEGERAAIEEIGDGWAQEIDGLRIGAGALEGGPLPALAYRFEAGGRSLVVSGTGWAPEALVAFASGAHMLVHEGVFIPPTEDLEEAGVLADPQRLESEAAIHTSLLDVGGLASRAGVESLVLVRLRPPPFFRLQVSAMVGKSYSGRVEIPDDGDEMLP